MLAIAAFPNAALLVESDRPPALFEKQLSSVLLRQIHHNLHRSGGISQTNTTHCGAQI